MRILITGGAGFIGSHMAKSMLDDGHIVTIVDDLSTGSLSNIHDLIKQDGFQFVRENVCNIPTMTTLIQCCDVVIHLAAAVGVQLIVEKPVHTLETNIHGSEVVLALANKFHRRILIASTSEVYGKSTAIPFNEDDDSLLGSTRFTRWSYACSKMVDEFLALAYHDQDGLEVIVGRFFNTIGPRQSGEYGMVVPRFVRAALRNEPLTIYGTGEQQRCFCHVADVIDAVKRLMVCETAIGQVVNIGSENSITINELAENIISMCNSTSIIRRISYEEAFGQPFDDMLIRKPDLTKIKQLISYEPKHSLEQTLRHVIEFERSILAQSR
ncbi:MAG: GDP-mannose 4,6-dehydratase [Deltaproteobacteria bacterium]|nr:GDP-mannose 4,6-dehydratase [Deltaproteobacteria bacterium]